MDTGFGGFVVFLIYELLIGVGAYALGYFGVLFVLFILGLGNKKT